MDNRAVSPVIGIILMVAVTVILASTVGAAVLGMYDGGAETSPTASIDIDANTASDKITLTHKGGDEFTEANTEEIRVLVNGTEEVALTGADVAISTGEKKKVTASTNGVADGETVTVVWVGEDNSAVIAEEEA